MEGFLCYHKHFLFLFAIIKPCGSAIYRRSTVYDIAYVLI